MKIYQVDAFTDRPFAGNPAGVCILPHPVAEGLMQTIAREMNLSETAFLVPHEAGYNLRWFTPSAEVDLCGHATLASAHILWEQGYLSPAETARFDTKSGRLTARQNEGWIELDFPALLEEPAEPPQYLLEALQVDPVYLGRNRIDYIIEIESEAQLKSLKPDFTMLLKVPMRGVIVTSRSTGRTFDFVSRFFAPEIGVFEDPVTGSAHCCLGPYWQKRTGKKEFLAYQASARGGVIKVTVNEERVIIGGQAVTVLDGELHE